MNQVTQKYLSQIGVAAKLDELLTKYQIEKKKQELIEGIIGDYLEGKIAEEEIANEMAERANIDFNVALDLAFDIISEVIPLVPEEARKKIPPIAASEIEEDDLSIKEIMEGLKKEAGLKLGERQVKRFEEIILNRLRDIRDDQETQDMLTRSVKIGGVDLDYNQAQKVGQALKQKIADYQAEGIDLSALASRELASQAEIYQQEGVAEQEIDVAAKPAKLEIIAPRAEEKNIEDLLQEKKTPFEQLAKKEEIKKELSQGNEIANPLVAEIEKESSFAKALEDKEEFLESREELMAPPEIQAPQLKDPPVSQPVEIKEPTWEKTETLNQDQEIAPVSSPIIRKTEPENFSRPKVEDVKFAAKLVGPVEELASLSIADFRRISRKPEQAAAKILDKLELLAEESLLKKEQGIYALKSSALYKAYADVMNAAMLQGKTLEQIIADNPLMSFDEFKAIRDLNKNLKY